MIAPEIIGTAVSVFQWLGASGACQKSCDRFGKATSRTIKISTGSTILKAFAAAGIRLTTRIGFLRIGINILDKDFLTFALGAAGWVVAVVTLVMGYMERQSAREQDRLGKTLDYFDGGSQRRSIGISMLEGVWLQNRRYHSVLVPLVANQIVYLLLSTDSHDAHNERNLVRLVMILRSIPDLRLKYRDRWGDVCDAIDRKLNGEAKGIPIAETTLREWATSLRDLGAP